MTLQRKRKEHIAVTKNYIQTITTCQIFWVYLYKCQCVLLGLDATIVTQTIKQKNVLKMKKHYIQNVTMRWKQPQYKAIVIEITSDWQTFGVDIWRNDDSDQRLTIQIATHFVNSKNNSTHLNHASTYSKVKSMLMLNTSKMIDEPQH